MNTTMPVIVTAMAKIVQMIAASQTNGLVWPTEATSNFLLNTVILCTTVSFDENKEMTLNLRD